MNIRNSIPSLIVLVSCFLLFYGCATFSPRPIDEIPFRERAQTKVEGSVRVTAAVLSAKESEAVFGVPVYKKGIQPVWLEIENNDEQPVWFLPIGLDPDYFTPFEVAYRYRSRFARKANQGMEYYFHEQAMGAYIPPGGVRSGFVFTHLDMGTKDFNVDLVGEDQETRRFTFFIPVPGLKIDHREVDWQNLYSENEIVSYHDAESFRKALESLPCCTASQDGTKTGEPLNLVIIGKGEDVHRALIRSGWDETESASASAAQLPAILPKKYRYDPVEFRYCYGRHQDVAFRKTRETAGERNHLRLWVSPMIFDDTNVWVGQISRNIRRSVLQKFRMEPDADEVRDYVFQDLWYAQALLKYAYVKGVGAAPISEPRQIFDGDFYFTNGHRLLLWVSSDPISFSEVEFVEWEIPPRR